MEIGWVRLDLYRSVCVVPALQERYCPNSLPPKGYQKQARRPLLAPQIWGLPLFANLRPPSLQSSQVDTSFTESQTLPSPHSTPSRSGLHGHPLIHCFWGGHQNSWTPNWNRIRPGLDWMSPSAIPRTAPPSWAPWVRPSWSSRAPSRKCSRKQLHARPPLGAAYGCVVSNASNAWVSGVHSNACR